MLRSIELEQHRRQPSRQAPRRTLQTTIRATRTSATQQKQALRLARPYDPSPAGRPFPLASMSLGRCTSGADAIKRCSRPRRASGIPRGRAPRFLFVLCKSPVGASTPAWWTRWAAAIRGAAGCMEGSGWETGKADFAQLGSRQCARPEQMKCARPNLTRTRIRTADANRCRWPCSVRE